MEIPLFTDSEREIVEPQTSATLDCYCFNQG